MKLRIDFSIRETDVPPEEARGVRFGDDIEATQVFDFFNKCRDAVLTLFGQKVPKNEEKEKQELQLERLKAEIERLKREALIKGGFPRGGDPGRPHRIDDGGRWEYKKSTDDIRKMIATRDEPRMPNFDDGSRGGDGPPSPEWTAEYKRLNDPNYGRY